MGGHRRRAPPSRARGRVDCAPSSGPPPRRTAVRADGCRRRSHRAGLRGGRRVDDRWRRFTAGGRLRDGHGDRTRRPPARRLGASRNSSGGRSCHVDGPRALAAGPCRRRHARPRHCVPPPGRRDRRRTRRRPRRTGHVDRRASRSGDAEGHRRANLADRDRDPMRRWCVAGSQHR